MLVVLSMTFALVTAARAGSHASPQQRFDDGGVRIGLTAEDSDASGAHVDTVEAQPDAPDHLGDVLLSQVSVGVGDASLRALVKRIEGSRQYADVGVHGSRVGGE